MKKNYFNPNKNWISEMKFQDVIYNSKKVALFLIVFFHFGINNEIKAQSGIYESYAILNSNGGGNVYYDLQATTATTDFQGANLGVYKSGNTLVLNGAQNKVYKCNTDDITNGKLYYRIYKTTDIAPVFLDSNIGFSSNDSGAGPGCQNQTWQSNGANINVLNSLTSGNYYLEIYTTADFTYSGVPGFGTHFAGNGGNNYIAQFTIDNPPIALCKSYTAQLDASGNVTITASDIDGGSTDDIGIVSFSVSQTTFTCANLGTNNVTLTVTDSNGQTATCVAVITVEDNQAPVPTLTTLPTITGQCSATVTAPTAADVCSGSITGTTANPLSYATQGTYNIVWTFNDGNGNTITQNQTVIVDDTIAPVPTLATLPTITGQCSATVTAPTAADVCSGSITGTTANPLSYATQGTYNIVWTFDDGNGNTITQNQTVIVDDTIAPVTPTLANVNVGQCSGTPTAPTTTDACAGTITGTTSTVFPITTQGTTVVTWTFNDGNGNSTTANQNVIVDDNVAPVPTLATLPTITGQCSATVTAPTAADVCSGSITGTTANPLSYATQGTYNIVWTFNDGNGNTITQNQTVIVDDTIAPVPTLATLPTITGQCSATVTAPTAADVCSGSITGTTANPLSYATQGTYNIVWTFDDSNGNTITQNQTVIVDDTIAPVTPTLANVNVGQCSGTPTAPTTTDACAGTITGTTSTIFPITTQGTTVVTWTFADGNGNSTTANQNVIVDDTIKPTLTAIANRNENIVSACSFTIPDYTGLTTASDNCTAAGSIIKTQSPVSGTVISGHNTTQLITITANDGNGNTESTTFTITLKDVTAPQTPVLANVNVGQCSGTPTAPTTTDACAGTITGTTSTVFPITTQGTTVVTWTFNDGNGNSTTANQNVIVDDNVAPVPTLATLPTITGQCSATVTAPTAADVCSGSITGTTANPLSYATQGTYNIVWTFNDGNGNTITQNQTVIVDDTIAPVPTLATLPTITGQCSATVTAPTAADVCSGSITGTTANPLSYATQGTYNIVWTFDDGNGNTTTQNQTVIVDDTVAPVTPTLANVNVGQCSGTPTAPTTTDACAGTITGTTSTVFPITTQGTTVVTWTFNDGNGNSTTANQNVIVDDTIKPTLTAIANRNENIVSACSFTIPDYTGLTTASDNCTAAGSIIKTQSPVSGTVISGHNTTQLITITANDGNGNTESTTFTITLKDVTAPQTPVLANVNVGQCSGTPTVPTTTDACAGTITGTTSTIFPITTQGTTVVTWTFADGNGNSTTANQNVIVDDTIKPTLTAIANRNENIVSACSFTIPDYTGLTTASDNCTAAGSIIKTQSPVSGTIISGHNTTQLITITANDGNGNTESTTFTITLKDVTVPTIICPATATANTNNDGVGNCTTIVSLGTPTVSDNCTPVGSIIITAKVGGVTINPSTYLFGIGSTTVVWTATDQNGNVSIPCNQTVTVTDNENPTINCTANVQVAANAGCTATGVALGTPTTADNCSVASVSNNAPVTFPLGSTTVSWTATDASGNTATCTQTVTVLDQTLPTVSCKNIFVNLNALGTASITAADINNNSTDNCGIASLSASKTTFDCTNLGANTVTLTVTDTSGNISSCTATVTIVDAIVPVALCKPFTLNLNAAGNATLLATDIDNGSSDNCSFTRTISKSSFDCSNIGANTVTLTITDTSGNSASCNATVTVVDIIAPVAQCKNFTLNLNAAGSATLLATDIDNGSTDNCGITTRTVSPSSFTCANVGNNTVTLTVKDASNNTSTCTATVTIRDLIAPTAICKPATIYLSSTGIATLTTADVNNGSSDNCGSVTLSLSKTSFDCSNLGVNTATLTVTDTAGNSSTCNATVTVVDNIAPVATCKNFTLVLAANGTGTLLPANINNGSSDNCGIATMTLSKTNFTCTDANGTPQSVTLTVTDAAGNSNSCTAIVTVQTTLTISSVYLETCGARFVANVSGGSGIYSYLWDVTSSTVKPFSCSLFGLGSNTATCASPYYRFVTNIIHTATLTVTDSNGCKVSKTFTFDGGAFNGSTATTNATACVGQTVTYTSSALGGTFLGIPYTYTYGWNITLPTGASVISGGGSANNTVTVNWGGAGVGKVSVTNTPSLAGSFCFSVDVFNVTVNPLPVPAFVNPILSTCPQSTQTYTLTANTFATRAWTVTGGTVTSGGDPADNSVTVKWGNGATGTVSVSVTNANNCSAAVSTTVNIVDTTPPTITCPANVSVNANTGLCYATGVNLGTPITNDNCGVASVTNNALTLFPTGQYPIGVSTITWTVTDYKGLTATCTQTVTVTDNQFPVIACPTNVSQSILTGCSRSITIANPTTSDNCGVTKLTWTMTGATVDNSPATGINNVGTYTFNRGVTTITYTAFDNSGKSSSCSFTVAVSDNIPPTITCPSSISTTTNSACTATGVALGTPTTADNCSVVSVTNNAPAAYPIGLTTVTWTVTDVAGLTATCTQTATVTDATPPTIACPSNISTTTAVGVCTRLVNVPSPTTADNCSVASLSWIMSGATTATGINAIGNYTFNLGITTVQYTVTDSANNTANCSFTVTVNDNQPPVFTSCPSNPSPLCADNSATYIKTGTSWNAAATDSCSAISSLTYTLSGSTTGSGTSLNGVAFNVGTTTVTWTATDTAGNTSNCVFTVTIIGLPVITTQPIAQLDCERASVNFTVIATGTGLTYSWQYKKPSDLSYTVIVSNSTNIDNFNENKITIRNVGSAQFPTGTLFQVIVSNSSGCSITSSAATLLVNEVTGISPSATNVTQCYGTNYSYTVSTSAPSPGYVVSYQWKSSVVSGVWNNVADGPHFSGANTATLNIINGTPSESAEYKVQVIFHSSGSDCNVTTTLNRKITFLPELTPPVATITQPDCITPTGTVVLSGLPAGNWTINPGGITGNTSSVTISGLVPNTYNFTVTSGTCTSLPSANVVVQAATTAIWNGSAWTNGPPALNQALEFTGNYNSAGDLTACSCKVTAGDVTINSGDALTITNWVHVNGGSLTFEDSASLVQVNNVSNTNSGNIIYKRLTTKISNLDYTYWASPVAGFTLGGVSPLTSIDKYYSFDSSIENWKQESAATSMVSGIGYIIRGPQTYKFPNPPNLYEATFIGVPHNGHYEINGITANRSYLLGNPYPSALDANTFLDDNQNVLDGTLYFWTHNTPIAIGTPDPGSGVLAYSGDDYASYNRTGGVATAAAPSASTGGKNTNIPSGKIASGQGFFGSSKLAPTGTTIVYDNRMRVGVGGISGNNSQFYKTKDSKGKTANELEKHRIWLDLTNTKGAFKQTLIGYVANATNDYEGRFDGESYDGNNFLDFYSINEDKNLTIQGRALPFDENDEVSLGYRVALEGTFTIKIGQTDGLLNNQQVFLEDKLTNTITNLKTGNYTFNTTAGTFDNRFVLRYKDKTLSVEKIEKSDGMVVLYSNNFKTLIIRNNVKDATVNLVTLFNMSGQKIAYWDVKGREQALIQIPIKNLPSEIYIVKIKTTEGEFSKKIIIK